ncbi:MAG: hypothetical protein KA118_08270 [Verrucomicrobia bacterium]|nr:hypothetical protein [Verrucomicrobiota bacterium]
MNARVANPSFSDPARHAIASQIDYFSFDASRRDILMQLNQRAAGAPPAALP